MPSPTTILRTARSHPWRALGAVWVPLLIASWIVRLVAPPAPFTVPINKAGRASIEAPLFDARGAIEGHTQTLGYWDWNPHGERGTVVMLHGSPSEGANMAPLADRLEAAGYRVLSPDLPGFGASTRWIPDYGAAAQAHGVRALLDTLGVVEAHLLAWSNGGVVALRMLEHDPSAAQTLTLLGATGAQKAEGSGSYWFEHGKYAIGYATVVLGPELLPHFGLFESVGFRHAFLRNFYDTDQRPMAELMRTLETPTLVLHGRRDFLVPPWGAEYHHTLLPDSTLVMHDEGGHMMPFLNPDLAAQTWLDFVAAHARGERLPDSIQRGGRLDRAWELATWPVRAAPWWLVLALLVPSAAWRPRQSIGIAAWLVAGGQLDLGVVTLGAVLAAWIGWAERATDAGRMSRGRAVLRGLVGPAAGWAACMGVLMALPFRPHAPAMALGLVASLLAVWLVDALVRPHPAARTRAGLARLAHHSHWPAWVRYALVSPWILMSGLRRGSPLAFTACNPGVPNGGGVAGESKFDTLSNLRARRDLVAPTAQVPLSGVVRRRIKTLRRALEQTEGLAYPLVLKPDAAEHGVGVRVVRDEAQAEWYLDLVSPAVAAQPCVDLPGEAAILWLRDPEAPEDAPPERAGSVFSLATKTFPEVVGDGESSVQTLIDSDRTLRASRATFLERLGERSLRVPERGERVRLAFAGNHCLGTAFHDAPHLITPGLSRSVGELATGYRDAEGRGLDAVRFDVRFEDEANLAEGEGFVVLELNGVTGESANIYDRRVSLARSLRIMIRHWSRVQELGAWRIAMGGRALTWRELWRLGRTHARRRRLPILPD